MQGVKALGGLLSLSSKSFCDRAGRQQQQRWRQQQGLRGGRRHSSVGVLCGWCAWAVGAGVGSWGERGQTQQSWRLLAGGLALGFVLLGLLPLIRDVLR